MALSNPWVGYIDRSYQQIKAQVITASATAVPEITDHTENDLFVKMISIWAGLSEMIGYYIDNKGREVYLSTARKFESAVKIAKLFDYRIRGTAPSVGFVTFYFDTPVPTAVTIPAGTIVSTREGVQYLTLSGVVIGIGDTTATVQVKQWTPFVNQVIGVSNGTADQTFPLVQGVVYNNISLLVGVTSYQNVDTLAYSLSDDTHYIAGVEADLKTWITFGDDFSGKIPPISNNITVSYYTSLGAAGNTAAGTINQVVSSVAGVPPGMVLKVINNDRTSGGVDQEDLATLKRRIPIANRTMKRAVTRADYEGIAQLTPGVAKAKVSFNCGKTVDVYIAPTGGGVASPALLDDVEAYFEDKRMLTTKVRALPAGEIVVVIGAKVTVKANYLKSTVSGDIVDRLVDFLSVDNQDISGRVNLGDIYEVIETTEGVAFSEVTTLQPQPFALVAGNTTTELDWEVALKAASNTVRYFTIQMNSPTVFQLYRDNIYLGNYNVGDLVDLTEVAFTINASSYVSGDKWTFSSYPYFGSFQLQEFSIPVTFAENISLNMQGGI